MYHRNVIITSLITGSLIGWPPQPLNSETYHCFHTRSHFHKLLPASKWSWERYRNKHIPEGYRTPVVVDYSLRISIMPFFFGYAVQPKIRPPILPFFSPSFGVTFLCSPTLLPASSNTLIVFSNRSNKLLPYLILSQFWPLRGLEHTWDYFTFLQSQYTKFDHIFTLSLAVLS